MPLPSFHVLRNVFFVRAQPSLIRFFTYSRRLGKRRRFYRLEKIATAAPRDNPQVHHFRDRLYSSDLPAVLEHYPALMAQKLLTPVDTLEIARLLHYNARSGKSRDWESADSFTSTVLGFQDMYMNGNLPPHPEASLHLICLWRTLELYDHGIELFNWLLTQSYYYMNLKTYGAAIELVAEYGKDLEYCEQLYHHALKQKPFYFMKYYLSVPDRRKPTYIRGTSLTLLQGIMKARLIHGDWRNAYLALDTALQLHPGHLPRLFTHVFLFERPLHEALQVFRLASQSGSQPGAKHFTRLLQSLKWARSFDRELRPTLQFAIAMVNSVHCYIAANNELLEEHLDILLQTCYQIFQENPLLNVDQMIEVLSQILTSFRVFGINPDGTQLDYALFASRRGSPKLILWTLDTFLPFAGELSEQSLKLLLGEIAVTNDAALVEKVWALVVENLLGPPSLAHLELFTRASVRAGNLKFIHQQMNIWPNSESIDLAYLVDQEIPQVPPDEDEQAAQVDSEWSSSKGELDQFLSAIASFGEMVTKRQDWSDLEKNPIKQDNFFTWPFQVEESWQRKLWDELSQPPLKASEASEPVAAQDVPIDRVSTGLALEEVRYRNWKGVNDLLLQAEMSEAKIQSAADAAIRDRTATRRIRGSGKEKDSVKLKLIFREQALERAKQLEEATSWNWTEDTWRQKILTLRGIIKSPVGANKER